MKKALLAVLLPMIVVATGAIAFYWWDRGAPPGFRPELVDVTPEQVGYDHRGVRLEGTAHYAAKLVQRSGGGDRTWYLFPVLDKGDTMGRYVEVVVRTTVEPDPLLGFEDVVIEGLARPPGSVVGPQAREAMIEAGYELDEKLVLIEAYDD